MAPEPTVFVVDDDEGMRDSLRSLFNSVGHPVQTYPDARAFLAAYDAARPGCLVLDLRMPGLSGMELQQRLVNDGVRIPVIIISAHGDIETAVRAMKIGAVDFIRKPYEGKVLLERVRSALYLDTQIRRQAAAQAAVAARIAHLTPREREVMEQLVAGKSPKQIALELGVSRKTVDVHRSHIMAKLQVDSVVELVRMIELQTGQGTQAEV